MTDPPVFDHQGPAPKKKPTNTGQFLEDPGTLQRSIKLKRMNIEDANVADFFFLVISKPQTFAKSVQSYITHLHNIYRFIGLNDTMLGILWCTVLDLHHEYLSNSLDVPREDVQNYCAMSSLGGVTEQEDAKVD